LNSGAVARIEILDRGNGIPDNLLERAMEPFFRANPVRSPRAPVLVMQSRAK
jgi:signal transduction histidine kinase